MKIVYRLRCALKHRKLAFENHSRVFYLYNAAVPTVSVAVVCVFDDVYVNVVVVNAISAVAA